MAVLSPRGVSHGVAYRGAERPGMRGVVHWRGFHVGPPGLHHHAPVWLLLERGTDHIDLALDPEEACSEAECAAPLSGSGLRSQPPYTFRMVVEGLGHGRVRLVRSGRRDGLVLVIDPRRCAERAFEAL